MTFDWAQIAYIGSPLLTPFWTAANVVGGLVIVMWIVAPIMYYRNTFYSSFMPILSSSVFDDTGNPYDLSKTLTPDYRFNHKAYSMYSKIYLLITYALSYAVQFASLSALVTHTVCWHGLDILQQSQSTFAHVRGEDKSEYQRIEQESRHHSNVSSERSSKTPFIQTGLIFSVWALVCYLFNSYLRRRAPAW